MTTEELFTIQRPIAIGIGDGRIRLVEVELVAIGDVVGIGVGSRRVEPGLRFQGVGVVVRILIGLGSDSGLGGDRIP